MNQISHYFDLDLNVPILWHFHLFSNWKCVITQVLTQSVIWHNLKIFKSLLAAGARDFVQKVIVNRFIILRDGTNIILDGVRESGETIIESKLAIKIFRQSHKLTRPLLDQVMINSRYMPFGLFSSEFIWRLFIKLDPNKNCP